jgi:hypothetical protein
VAIYNLLLGLAAIQDGCASTNWRLRKELMEMATKKQLANLAKGRKHPKAAAFKKRLKKK